MTKALPFMLVATSLMTTSPASAESRAPLSWISCGTTGSGPSAVAARTQCASLVVPRDHANPAAGTLVLDVDEFAGKVGTTVPAMASAWLHGGDVWRHVSQRLDLVGLAQRRMDDAGGNDCLSATSSLPHHVGFDSDTTNANLIVAEGLARAIATACQNDPMHAHIGAQARIHDMELLREALGESRLHLLGVGRGGWVAARYAERYPQNVGRMLLDSSWDIDGSVAEAMEARVAERDRALRRGITEVLGSPDRHDDPYGFGSRAAGTSPAQLASVFATRCNDGHWGSRQRYWRQRTHELRGAWPSGAGNETFQGMVCSVWPGAWGGSRVPNLDAAPSFLMVHAEFDNEAPLRNAVMGLHGHSKARMVVARGLRAHGVATLFDRPCVAAVTGHYLADGVLPDAKLTNCALPAATP
jgi:pimeloyl-ACP methyl ester carboxylesterase